MLTLLLSPMIGTTAGKKPDNPGPKPPPRPETFLFDISIVGEELELDEPEYLEVNTHVCRGGWYDDPAKKTKVDGWGATLGDDEGIGTFSTSLLGEVPTYIDVQYFQIQHLWTSQPTQGLGYDGQPTNFWEFYLNWGWNEEDYTTGRTLRVWTDYGAEPEGIYYGYDPEPEDMWIVDFNGASWELWASDEYGYGHLESSGTISELTVTIIKTT